MEPALVDQLLVAAAALGVTVLVTPLVRVFARSIGAVKVPGERHIHSVPTPELGGLAMVAGLIAAYAVAARLPTFDELFRTTSEPEAILLAALMIVFVGVVDDTRQLGPAVKLAGQIMAAGTLVLFGVTLRFVYIPFGGGSAFGGSTVSLSPDVAALVTIIAVVAMINAVNLVDGLDGLAAGIVAIAAMALFAYAELRPDSQIPIPSDVPAAGLVLAAVVGMCLGFLVYNFNPASIFMGDTGSMLLGLLMGAAGISAIGNTLQPTSTDFFAASVPALIPVLVLAVPFLDTSLAIVRRLASGQSISSPDKKHLHHRLVDFGHSVRRAVLVMYGWSALLAFVVVGPSLVRGEAVTVISVAVAGLLLAYMTFTARRYRRTEQAIEQGANVRRIEGPETG